MSDELLETPTEYKTVVDPSLRESFLLTRGVQVDTPEDPTNYCPLCGSFPLPEIDRGRCCEKCRSGEGTIFKLDIFIRTYARFEIKFADPSSHDALLHNGDIQAGPVEKITFGDDDKSKSDAELRYPVLSQIAPHVCRITNAQSFTKPAWEKFKNQYKSLMRLDEESFLRIKVPAFLESITQWESIASAAAEGGSGRVKITEVRDALGIPAPEKAQGIAWEHYKKLSDQLVAQVASALIAGVPVSESKDDNSKS